MKATVKIIFLNALKVVKINIPNTQFKLRIRIWFLSESKNLVGFGFRIWIAIPRKYERFYIRLNQIQVE